MTTSIVTSWKSVREHSAAQHIMYNVLRGKPITTGFTPIREHNVNKICSSNNDKWNGFNIALSQLKVWFKPPYSDWSAKRNAEAIATLESVLGIAITDDIKETVLKCEAVK